MKTTPATNPFRRATATAALAMVALAATPGRGADGITIYPEVTTAVELSATDVNWVRCPGPIQDIVTSTEKSITTQYSGNNAFIKFLAIKKAGEVVYSEIPTELYVICQDDVYKMIVQPKQVPAVTVHLGGNKGDTIAKNRDQFAGLPWEKKILKLIREAYVGDLPDSYRAVPYDEDIPFSLAAKLHKVRGYIVDGEGIAVYEFRLTARNEPIEVTEEHLLTTDLNLPGVKAALALEHHLLQPNEATRVFVVMRNETERVPQGVNLMRGLIQ